MISVLIAVRVVTVVIAIVATVIVWVFILLEVEKFPKIAHHASTFLFFSPGLVVFYERLIEPNNNDDVHARNTFCERLKGANLLVHCRLQFPPIL